ncbi:regulator, partial [Streptomyces sp. B1866]|nr:regulator [Streptomyces sp. B1866]
RHPRGQADSLLGLAAAQRLHGRPADALASAGQARDLAARCGFRLVEGQARAELAEIHAAAGRPAEARDHATAAAAVQRETGHRLGEARALDALARALDALGRAGDAGLARQRSADLYAEAGAAPEAPATA